jgi:hypothetical protein
LVGGGELYTMRQFKCQNFLIFFIFLILAFVFFGIVLNNFFVSDDFDWLTVAKNTQNVFSYFSTNYWGTKSGGVYSPFLNLLFYFEYNVWHLNPFGYHLTNLLFHVGSVFFVFLIGLELFKKRLPAFLAGIFFLIFPAHAEAVNWISAAPHVIGTFFYLVCPWSYLKFRKSGKLKFIAVALAAFIFSLLTKELALTLPFVIIIFELLNLKFKEFSAGKKWWAAVFFIFSAIYILVRYFATGILFGYYATSSFILKVSQVFKTFVSGLAGLVSWGSARIYLTELFLDHKILFLILIFLVLMFFLIKRQKWQILLRRNFDSDAIGKGSGKRSFPVAEILKPRGFKNITPSEARPMFSWEFLASLSLFAIPFGLILFLQFNPTSDEGERYLYLPSAGFCLLLGFLLPKIFKKKFWLAVFSLIIIFYFSFFLINKNLDWREASEISKKIVNDFGRVVDLKTQNAGIVFFSLPDTYRGAHVFRNGIKLAIALYYPDYQMDAIFLPIYLRLDKFNKNDKIINWVMGKNCDYIFGVSVKGKSEFTSFAREESEDFIFELWGYNYKNYTSNAVKLKIQEGMKEQTKNKKIYFLIYDEGELKEFKWCSI